MRTKQQRNLIPIAILFAVSIFVVIYFLLLPANTTTKIANNDSTATEVSSPTPLSANTKKLSSGSNASLPDTSSTVSASVSPAKQTKETNLAEPSAQSPSAESDIQIHIVDALGDPVHKGLVQLNGKSKEFNNGEVRFNLVPPGRRQVIVSAEGYQSVTKELNSPSQENVSIALEYLYSFACSVEREIGQDNWRPVPGAEVFVYPGPRVERPVNNTVTVSTIDINFNIVQTKIARNKDNFVVTNSPAILNSRDVRNSIGDRVTGFYGFDYEHGITLPENVSNRLRLWDSLNAFGNNPDVKSSLPDDELTLARDNKNYKVNLPKIPFEDEIKPVTQGISGVNGICRFSNLPAGTYFVQARLGQSRSQIGILHPCRLNQKLSLSEKSQLYVEVKRGFGLSFKSNDIPNAKITIQSLENDSKGLFMALTDKHGWASFQDIPFGRYQLTVTPPETIKQAPKIVQVNLNDEKKRITVIFDEKTYSIAGKMLFAEHREPASGYPLELAGSIDRIEESPIPDRGRHKPVYTASDGSFQFDGVPPGKYFIDLSSVPGSTVPLYEKGLFSASQQTRIDVRGNFEVTDKDITDLEYMVEKEVITQIDGTVVDKSGNPVPSAHITFHKDIYHFVEENPVTGNDGRFHLSVKTGSGLNTQSIRLSAYVKKQMQPGIPNATNDMQSGGMQRGGMQIGGQSDGMQSGGMQIGGNGMQNEGGGGGGKPLRVPYPKNLLCWGETLISFHAGSKVENIKIVVDAPKNNISISGKITAEDGKPYTVVRVNAYQENERTPGIVEPDGSYSVYYLEPGPVNLMVEPDPVRQFVPQFGFRQVIPVLFQSHELTLPQNGNLHFDIRLTSTASLSGMVKNKQNMPSPYCIVTAYNGVDFTSCDTTDKRGFFYIDALKPGTPYRLVVQNPEISKKPLSTLENVKPQKNLIVVIEK